MNGPAETRVGASHAGPGRWLGIDFSGDAGQWSPGRSRSNVWLATIEGDGSEERAGLRLASVHRVQALSGDGPPFARLARRLGGGDFQAAAIDAPFSLPASVAEGATHEALRARIAALPRLGSRPFGRATDLVAAFLPAQAPRGEKLYRETEESWRSRGVNVRATTWAGPRGGAAMTVACLTLLHEADAICWPWSRAGRSLVAEGFPAAQLQQWGLSHQRYGRDGRVDAANRARIVTALEARLAMPEAMRGPLLESPDAIDATLCALSAVGLAAGRLASEPEAIADVEGWIAVHA